MYCIVPVKEGIPDVGSVRVVSAIGKDKTSAYANVETDKLDPVWIEITDPKIINKLSPAPEVPLAPEIGPILMDITLKQAELEMKLDAIGTMLVPTIPEV